MAALDTEPPTRSPLIDEPNPSAAVESDGKRARSPTPERQSKRQRTSQSKSPPPDTTIETSAKSSDTLPSSSTIDESRETDLTKSTSPPPQQQTAASPPQERPTGPGNRGRRRVDEGQRARRLFGALLNLDQKPDERTTRQRREIELRKKAELRQQDERRASFEQRDPDRVKQKRRRPQHRDHRDSISIRHDNLFHTAHFLQTQTEPQLYYLPWTLRPEEEDRIDEQIAEARALIEREKSHSKNDVRRRRSTTGETAQIDQARADATLSDREIRAPSGQPVDAADDHDPSNMQRDGDDDVTESISKKNLPSQDIASVTTTTAATSSLSDNEEIEMEDGDEDTVLY